MKQMWSLDSAEHLNLSELEGNGMIESVLFELTALDVALFEIEVEILMVTVNSNDMTICMA